MVPIWGDGFAGDGLRQTLAVADWDGCSPDEYAVLFPRLLSVGGALAPVLQRHLEACVAARAWRIARLDRASPAPEPRSRVPSAFARELHRVWFSGEGAVDRLLRRWGMPRTPPDRIADERRLLVLLDATLDGVQRGFPPAWSEEREAWFAFGSGIHSAYLWAESAISPDRCLAAAWLGHLDRGRTALMPPAVADYLTDAVLDPSRPRDRTIAAMVRSPEDARHLRRAAALRLAGRDPAVSLGRGRRLLPGVPSPAPALRGDALEHA